MKKQSSSVRQVKVRNAGFTLVELMASMTILAIAVVSIIAIQSASLQSHITNQDQLVADSLADQFVEVLHTDALRWVSTLSQTTFLSNSVTRPMTFGASEVQQNWIPYTNRPVNFQMSPITATNNAGIRARFCLFYRYRWAGQSYSYDNSNFTVNLGEVQTNNMLEVNVVVLWPRNYRGLPTAAVSGQTHSYNKMFSTCGSPTGGSTDFNDRRVMFFQSVSQPTVRQYFRQVRRTTLIRRDVRGLGT